MLDPLAVEEFFKTSPWVPDPSYEALRRLAQRLRRRPRRPGCRPPRGRGYNPNLLVLGFDLLYNIVPCQMQCLERFSRKKRFGRQLLG